MAAFLVAWLCLAARAGAVPSLDPAFGTGGVAPLQAAASLGRTVLVQPDGAIVVVGIVGVPLGVDLALTRLLPDGSPDPSFGVGGRTVQHLGNDGQRHTGIVRQSDGRLVVSATLGPANAETGALVRFDTHGALDPSFGSGGIVATGPGSIEALAVQPDDRLVVAGTRLTFTPSTKSSVWVGRFDPQGQPDATFGSGGVTVRDRSRIDAAAALVLEPSGAIVVGGGTGGAPFVAPPADFLLERFEGNGSPDAAFGTGGVVVTDFGFGVNEYARSLVRQQDGKLVAVGTATSSTTTVSTVAVARYDATGALDPTYGTGVVAGTAFLGTGKEYTVAAAIDASDRILVAGVSMPATGMLMRVDTNGALEAGWPWTTNGSPGILGVAVQSDGRIVALGDRKAFRILTGDACGNGALDPGEACDDGNTLSGDCCSAICTREPRPTCNDPGPCTNGDTVGRPRTDCRTTARSGGARLQVSDAGRTLRWQLGAGDATLPGELGDPIANASSTHDVCVFDEAGATPVLIAAGRAPSNAAPVCVAAPCWKRSASGRLAFRHSVAAGVARLELWPGAAGKSRVRVVAASPFLVSPSLPLGAPLRVQLWASDGTCFEAVHSGVGVRRNTARRFEGVSD